MKFLVGFVLFLQASRLLFLAFLEHLTLHFQIVLKAGARVAGLLMLRHDSLHCALLLLCFLVLSFVALFELVHFLVGWGWGRPQLSQWENQEDRQD
jgi:hypothetical protein